MDKKVQGGGDRRRTTEAEKGESNEKERDSGDKALKRGARRRREKRKYGKGKARECRKVNYSGEVSIVMMVEAPEQKVRILEGRSVWRAMSRSVS